MFVIYCIQFYSWHLYCSIKTFFSAPTCFDLQFLTRTRISPLTNSRQIVVQIIFTGNHWNTCRWMQIHSNTRVYCSNVQFSINLTHFLHARASSHPKDYPVVIQILSTLPDRCGHFIERHIQHHAGITRDVDGTTHCTCSNIIHLYSYVYTCFERKANRSLGLSGENLYLYLSVCVCFFFFCPSKKHDWWSYCSRRHNARRFYSAEESDRRRLRNMRASGRTKSWVSQRLPKRTGRGGRGRVNTRAPQVFRHNVLW